MGLLRFALAQLRGGWRRTLAALLAVFTAVTSFVLLTGSAQTQRLEVTKTVDENFRGAYDILVRPKGSTTALERSNDQVRPSFLSGVYGGITLEQLEQIRGLGGTSAVAPIAMLGVSMQYLETRIDIRDLLPPGQERGMFVYHASGRSRADHVDRAWYWGLVYVTRQPFTVETLDLDQADGSRFHSDRALVEIVDGVKRHPCTFVPPGDPGGDGTFSMGVTCYSLATPKVADPDFRGGQGPGLPVAALYPLPVAAIDPVEEAKLVGLDAAVTQGRYLTDTDTWSHGRLVSQDVPDDVLGEPPRSPALLSLGQAADYSAALQIRALSAANVEQFVKTTIKTRSPLKPEPVGPALDRTVSGQALYEGGLKAVLPSETWQPPFAAGSRGVSASIPVSLLLRPGEVDYAPGTPLRPKPVGSRPLEFQDFVPVTMGDTWFRGIDERAARQQFNRTACRADPDTCFGSFGLQVVGRFDPGRIREGGSLGKVPLETYATADLLAADQATKQVLGGDKMLSDLNPAGYAQLPPALLIPLKSLPMIPAVGSTAAGPAPISAIRVRVAGMTGVDAISRERIRVVAERIRTATGLDVDIVAGSSPLPQRVELPKTQLGVPALNLHELWTKKGVGVAIVEAVDAKSVVLFVPILVSCAITVAVIARASIAARRRELGVLLATGWPTGRLAIALLTEAALIGLTAGLLGALVGWPLTRLFGVAFDPWRALAAIPTATVLAMAASLTAALSAARITPATALTAAGLRGGKAFLSVRGPISYGITSLLRRPGRLLAGTLTIALGSGSLLFLTAINHAFAGAIVGNLLGDAIALQTRTPDLIAAAILGALGLISTAVILYLGITDDAESLASLKATGWRDTTLASSILTQAGLLALTGSVLGTGLALVTLRLLSPTLPDNLTWLTLTVILGTLVAALTTALAPALHLRRLPLSELLSRD